MLFALESTNILQKKIICLTTNNLLNLKSNTMKNTMQSYEFYVIKHNIAT